MAMRLIQLPRTGDAPLRFTGDEIASASSKRDGKRGAAKQWYEAVVYRTQGGGFVAAATYHTEWANERPHHWAAICEDAACAVAWLRDLDVTGIPVGFPEGDQFAAKQEGLIRRLKSQWAWLVGEILNQCGDVFAEEVP